MSHPALTQSAVAHLTNSARNFSYGVGYYDYGVGRRYDPFQKKVLDRAAYREGYEACRQYWNGPVHFTEALSSAELAKPYPRRSADRHVMASSLPACAAREPPASAPIRRREALGCRSGSAMPRSREVS
jgi:hypothetical protein